MFSRTGTTSGESEPMAVSNSASPCSVVMGGRPAAVIRWTSACDMPPVIPVAWAHNPQGSDKPGNPCAWRWAISASTQALAAA
ncbi:hypothetical protein Amac_038340 [Acrocarpospora macrocephala]|uniref:Uncharacterized protein n=1 Tax=Acrocarpospora macrocephala TaxID=150177 RepID=A0A5M3WLT5_9ACTN|nr:hypothetical protein Amac_038340 [Acrocarpospora macrocephala]